MTSSNLLPRRKQESADNSAAQSNRGKQRLRWLNLWEEKMLILNSFITYRGYRSIWSAGLLLLLLATAALAQTTAFTYQGKLTNQGNPANNTYDLQFELYDALMGGNQVGATVNDPSVPVANGIFSVQLDFGPVFDGSARFL